MDLLLFIPALLAWFGSILWIIVIGLKLLFGDPLIWLDYAVMAYCLAGFTWILSDKQARRAKPAPLAVAGVTRIGRFLLTGR